MLSLRVGAASPASVLGQGGSPVESFGMAKLERLEFKARYLFRRRAQRNLVLRPYLWVRAGSEAPRPGPGTRPRATRMCNRRAVPARGLSEGRARGRRGGRGPRIGPPRPGGRRADRAGTGNTRPGDRPSVRGPGNGVGRPAPLATAVDCCKADQVRRRLVRRLSPDLQWSSPRVRTGRPTHTLASLP